MLSGLFHAEHLAQDVRHVLRTSFLPHGFVLNRSRCHRRSCPIGSRIRYPLCILFRSTSSPTRPFGVGTRSYFRHMPFQLACAELPRHSTSLEHTPCQIAIPNTLSLAYTV